MEDFNQLQMLHNAHDISLILRAASNGSICRIPRSHLDGAGGQVDQGQDGVHHVTIEAILTKSANVYDPPSGVMNFLLASLGDMMETWR